MATTLTDVVVRDIRFPTSRDHAGASAMNPDADYSAAYVTLRTDAPGLEGHGMTFTIGRGNELCVAAVNALKPFLAGRTLEDIAADMRGFWRTLTQDVQLRWLGPEKGVIHMAVAAVVNAVWDLYAKAEGKPLWKLLADMTPEQVVACIDFQYLTDAFTPGEALAILRHNLATKIVRERKIVSDGYPAYTASAGWLGHSDAQVRDLCRRAISEGWTTFKVKVGGTLEEDVRRVALVRREIGYSAKLLLDANQQWEVDEAIECMQRLEKFEPWWIEEPTCPDDIVGYVKIAKAIHPIRIAAGEHAQNRVVFKQLFQARAIDVCQIDNCRLGGVNEALAVLLMAAKYEIPVCPHAGGVGLSEYAQHLSFFDYIAVSTTFSDRFIEYADHLHEHFVCPPSVAKGRFAAPSLPGCSAEMRPESLDAYEFPGGRA